MTGGAETRFSASSCCAFTGCCCGDWATVTLLSSPPRVTPRRKRRNELAAVARRQFPAPAVAGVSPTTVALATLALTGLARHRCHAETVGLELDRELQLASDHRDVLVLVGSNEGDPGPRATGTSCAADAVHIVGVVVRRVEVDDVRDAIE